jgi:hypothetical protein
MVERWVKANVLDDIDSYLPKVCSPNVMRHLDIYRMQHSRCGDHIRDKQPAETAEDIIRTLQRVERGRSRHPPVIQSNHVREGAKAK